MFKAIMDIREDGLKEGREKGISETLMKNVESLMKNMGWDLSTTCRNLGIGEEEYHRTKEMLLSK